MLLRFTVGRLQRLGLLYLDGPGRYALESGPYSPTSLSISPLTVTASSNDCYTMTVGSGANETLDIQYRYNGGPVQTILSWLLCLMVKRHRARPPALHR